MNVTLIDEQDQPAPSELLVQIARLAGERLGLDPDTEVAITLIDPEEMAAFHEKFLGLPGPTDVMSFPLEDVTPGTVPRRAEGGPPVHLGDIFICPDYVARQAAARGVPYEDEMALMVVHGLLHLLGYDHEADDEAEIMEALERDLLAAAGRQRP